MSATNKTKTKSPCLCGHNRWKTKGDVDYKMSSIYECRKCRRTREITRKEAINAKV